MPRIRLSMSPSLHGCRHEFFLGIELGYILLRHGSAHVLVNAIPQLYWHDLNDNTLAFFAPHIRERRIK